MFCLGTFPWKWAHPVWLQIVANVPGWHLYVEDSQAGWGHECGGETGLSNFTCTNSAIWQKAKVFILTVIIRTIKVIALFCLVGQLNVCYCFSLLPVSYLVYAGLVFVSLSQPYMQHQYGKDWARKAPIRLCDRVLYGILDKTGQEVILLSQVMALCRTCFQNVSKVICRF